MIILLHIVSIVRITSPKLQPMAVQYHCHVIKKEIILKFSGSCGISLSSDWLRICWIWSVKYYICYTKLHIYEFLYKFDTVLYQFLETGTSDRSLICIVQRLRFHEVSFYNPFNFYFTVPLKGIVIHRICNFLDGASLY